MVVTATRSLTVLATLALIAGCGGVTELPADGGFETDAAPADAGSPADDGGAPDAASRDAGLTCGADETLCGGACVSLDEDPQHCGGCDVRCDDLPGVAPGLARCAFGACVVDACAAGRADCNHAAADGCETDLGAATDCGACGLACADVEVCSDSGDGTYACMSACGGTTPDQCGDRCVDVVSDPAHCGACDTACPDAPFASAVCVAGECGLACDPGYHLCGDACAPSTSVDSCGSRCTPCPVPANAMPTCDGSGCGFACLPGYGDCDGDASNGCEADVGAPTSCGGCGTDCTALPGVVADAVQCTAGACDVSGACAPGFADCAGGALDGCEADLTSTASCGACGVTCNAVSETCEPTGAGYACTNGCDASTPTLCGAACVDLFTDTANCGGCGASCPAPANTIATCARGECGLDCASGSHLCTDACLADDSVDSCGASCAPCPVPPNAMATCDGSSCGFECAPGFADCDGDPANGCELSLSDPSASVIFCDGFEHGLGAWTVENHWGTNSTAYAGSYSLRGYWGGSSSDCGITRSTYLASDIDLTGVTSATLEYRHSAIVGSSDHLYVLVSTAGGASWTPIDGPGGSGGFALRTVDLSAYAGMPVRIAFRFNNVCGDAYGVTWWVDDVAVEVTR